MARLSDDCFAHHDSLMTVAEALKQIETRLAPVVAADNVPLRAAAGRVLVQDVVATMNLPPHANSAVDGYAVAHSDLFPDRETVLSIGGRAAAGHFLGRPIRFGEAIRIFTGAPMPEGADTVIMQEDCVAVDGSDGGQVRIRPGARKGPNYRQAGEDVRAGAVPMRAGQRLLPRISALPQRSAATGCRSSGLCVWHCYRRAMRCENLADHCRAARYTTPTGSCFLHCSSALAVSSTTSAFSRTGCRSWLTYLVVRRLTTI